jgi:protein gp37
VPLVGRELMGETSAIGWTHRTWNPWQGCHKVSPGCRLCYMFREKRRYGQEPNVVVRSKPATFNAPLKWSADLPLVFTCSWSDWFIEEADAWRDEAWAIVDQRRDLIFQIVTKRIERAAGRLPWGSGEPWPHVWGIVSAEDEATAQRRIGALIDTNFAVRGVSYEPALGSVDFRPYMPNKLWNDLPSWKQPELDWIIVGGESADNPMDARPFNLAWARQTIAHAREAGVAVYLKQLGARPFIADLIEEQRLRPADYDVDLVPGGAGAYLRLGDRKGATRSQWPEDLRDVQGFPR